jgi:DNA-binding response OmpR family regulator
VQVKSAEARTRILLIEDNPADVFLIKEAMRAHNIDFELQWLSDGEEALGHIERHEAATRLPALILLDLNLPKVDGKELLSRIRRNRYLASTPVVILTSSDSPHDRKETASLGASCYIKKPPTLDEFLSVGSTIKMLLPH